MPPYLVKLKVDFYIYSWYNNIMKNLNEKLEKIIEQETMWEMSNFRKKVTGLPVNLSLQIETDEDKKYPHNLPRLKFQNNTADRITSVKDLIPVSIDAKNPRILIDAQYDKQIFKLIQQWIILNYDALMQFWNQEIDEFELKDLLKKV